MPRASHLRPLLLALALLTLLGAGAAAAQTMVPATARVIAAMQRDLGALRVQLEAIRPATAEAAEAATGAGIAYATDLADGGEAFRLRSLATMARTVVQRLDQLDRLAGASAVAGVPERDRFRVLRLQVHALHWAVEELRFAGLRDDPTGAFGRLDEILADLERSTATLLGRPAGS